MLVNRTRHLGENLIQYFLHMREIINNGNIADNSFMLYMIQGIDNELQNKTILFGCTNLIQFKEKLLI